MGSHMASSGLRHWQSEGCIMRRRSSLPRLPKVYSSPMRTKLCL